MSPAVDVSELYAVLVAAAVCLWPLVMYLGAALSAAGAVTEEIDRETALQLVLTPVAARPLAAAKVLPRVRPFLWGIVACLPLYCLAGSSPMLIAEGKYPLPTVVWPLRLAGPAFAGLEGSEASWAGVLLVGPAMCLLDLSLVWTAAQWGAVLAIRHRSLVRVALGLAGRLVITAAAAGLCVLAGLVAGMVPLSCAAVGSGGSGDGGAWPFLCAGIAGGALLFGFLWWQVILARPAQEVLTAFQAFDRLANAEFEVGLPRWVDAGGGGKGA